MRLARSDALLEGPQQDEAGEQQDDDLDAMAAYPSLTIFLMFLSLMNMIIGVRAGNVNRRTRRSKHGDCFAFVRNAGSQ